MEKERAVRCASEQPRLLRKKMHAAMAKGGKGPAEEDDDDVKDDTIWVDAGIWRGEGGTWEEEG